MNTEPSKLQLARIRIEEEYAASLAKAEKQFWADIRVLHETFLTPNNVAKEAGS